MSGVAINVESLSKAYRIGLKEQQHETLLGAAASWLKAPLSNLRTLRRLSRFGDAAEGEEADDLFWALRDVSFDVKHGEAIGIIGRNGAGKSTLLKILSRITDPTSGRARINGRVASLLEVGTGFHPDLTGRENIYLNGTILGMRKREIDRKFDEIVAFSGVELFIDTPVKRYSSGMRVRLAFSVAAHLEAEILIIDEVLAVGDAEFQRKCLGKMEDVASGGRSVLFVSHNMGAIARLCTRAISLHRGRVARVGQPAEVVQAYLDGGTSGEAVGEIVDVNMGPLTLQRLAVQQHGRTGSGIIDGSQPFSVDFEFSLDKELTGLLIGFDLMDSEGNLLFRTYDQESAGLGPRGPGACRATCRIPGGLLQPTLHHLNLLVGVHRSGWLSRNTLALRLDLTGPSPSDVDYPGVVRPMVTWEVSH